VANVPIHAVSVRPVGFDGYRAEALLDDEPFGDLGALVIELVRTVRAFAQQDDRGISDKIQERVMIGSRAV
jgi:hypothetical protein